MRLRLRQSGRLEIGVVYAADNMAPGAGLTRPPTEAAYSPSIFKISSYRSL
jgi:hypothetical protein